MGHQKGEGKMRRGKKGGRANSAAKEIFAVSENSFS